MSEKDHNITSIEQAVESLRFQLRCNIHNDVSQRRRQLQENSIWGCFQDLEKYESGIKYCCLYLNNCISLKKFCVLMEKCDILRDQLYEHAALFSCEDVISAQILTDEVN